MYEVDGILAMCGETHVMKLPYPFLNNQEPSIRLAMCVLYTYIVKASGMRHLIHIAVKSKASS